MADNGSTWMSETGTIVGSDFRLPRSAGAPPTSRGRRIVQTALLLAVTSLVCASILYTIPEDWLWETARITSVCIVLIFALRFSTGRFRPAFVIWWLVMVSECIFFREGIGDQPVIAAYKGYFPTAAYGEVVSWVLCFLAVFFCAWSIRGYFKRLFVGDFKWLTLFAGISFISCIYSTRATLGLAWGFKLCLVVLLLLLCSEQIREYRDVSSFLRFTFWAYVIIMLQPVVIAMFRGQMFDEEGRMSTILSPNALSPNAAVVVLMALALFSTRKGEGLRKSAAIMGFIGGVVMILAGSKTGIVAAVFAGFLFFFLRKKLGSAFGYVVLTGIMIFILALASPLGAYFHSYNEGGGMDTLSGRTILWGAVMPAIKDRIILGHGYMSSEFLIFQVNQVAWAAPQLHNGFLEALYNGGSIGLLIMLAIAIVIPVRLSQVLRRVPLESPIYRTAAGCIALWAFLIINGLSNSSYGGKPTSIFMLLLCLVIVADKLLEIASRSAGYEHAALAAQAGRT
jgi:O-antigen ligase